MALSNATIRQQLLTTIFGGRLGMTPAEFIGGPKDIQKAVQDIQSTVPTTANAHGYVRVLTSGSSQGPVQHNLPVPVPGVPITIMLNSTSTGSQQFLSTPNGAAIFLATAGTTVGVVNMVGPGGSVTLVGVSSSAWAVQSVGGSTAAGAPTFTTST